MWLILYSLVIQEIHKCQHLLFLNEHAAFRCSYFFVIKSTTRPSYEISADFCPLIIVFSRFSISAANCCSVIFFFNSHVKHQQLCLSLTLSYNFAKPFPHKCKILQLISLFDAEHLLLLG